MGVQKGQKRDWVIVKGVSNKGGEIHDNQVAMNIKEADGMNCKRCGKIITTLSLSGTQVRDNRVDCEDEILESYHLVCYDLELFGRITSVTSLKIRKFQEEVFGEA